MRSLGTVRARVERLASLCLPPGPETLIVHWKDLDQQCPSCGAALAADAVARAVAEADAARARGDGQVFSWADPFTTCPRCGAPLRV